MFSTGIHIRPASVTASAVKPGVSADLEPLRSVVGEAGLSTELDYMSPSVRLRIRFRIRAVTLLCICGGAMFASSLGAEAASCRGGIPAYTVIRAAPHHHCACFRGMPKGTRIYVETSYRLSQGNSSQDYDGEARLSCDSSGIHILDEGTKFGAPSSSQIEKYVLTGTEQAVGPGQKLDPELQKMLADGNARLLETMK